LFLHPLASGSRGCLVSWRVPVPGHWVVFMKDVNGFACRHKLAPNWTVIASVQKYHDGRDWLHVSTARTDRLPTYAEMAKVRKEFVPDHLVALQVFPPESEYVNIHPNCLHLYACLTERVTPDFRIMGGI